LNSGDINAEITEVRRERRERPFKLSHYCQEGWLAPALVSLLALKVLIEAEFHIRGYRDE
jgi:hypothetical protein